MLKNFWDEAVGEIFPTLFMGNIFFLLSGKDGFLFTEEPSKESEFSFFWW